MKTQFHSSDPYAPNGQDHSSPSDELETPVQASWWGAHDENGSSATPTAATFMRVEESSIQASGDGFISLMDSHTFSVGPSKHSSTAVSPARALDEDDHDDLGLGNSKPKPKPEQEENGSVKAQSVSPPANTAPAPPANTGKSFVLCPLTVLTFIFSVVATAAAAAAPRSSEETVGSVTAG